MASQDDPVARKSAIRLLGFRWTSARHRACVVAMDPHILDVTLKLHIKEIYERLEQAAGIARAAQACAETGNLGKAIEMSSTWSN